MSDTRLDLLADLVLAEQGFDEPLELLAMEPALRTSHGTELRAMRDAASTATAALLHRHAPPLPATLRRRLDADALAFCVELGTVHLHDFLASPAPSPVAAPGRRPWLQMFAMTGMLAAAGLLLMLTWQRPPSPPAARSHLLAADTANVRLDWHKGPSPKAGEVQGDVVWSDTRQEGYLRFLGLPPLTTTQQYQLWIVDAARTGAPVDGGLFELPDSGEAIVPIQARLPIRHAVAFVVTIEDRGGVVVSKQQDVVATAGL